MRIRNLFAERIRAINFSLVGQRKVAKETPFRGEDSVFFPPKDPLIETAKEGPSGPSLDAPRRITGSRILL